MIRYEVREETPGLCYGLLVVQEQNGVRKMLRYDEGAFPCRRLAERIAQMLNRMEPEYKR